MQSKLLELCAKKSNVKYLKTEGVFTKKQESCSFLFDKKNPAYHYQLAREKNKIRTKR